MACLYKRRRQYWISYYVNGKQIQKSLNTANERVARAKKRQIEYELLIGQLQQVAKSTEKGARKSAQMGAT